MIDIVRIESDGLQLNCSASSFMIKVMQGCIQSCRSAFIRCFEVRNNDENVAQFFLTDGGKEVGESRRRYDGQIRIPNRYRRQIFIVRGPYMSAEVVASVDIDFNFRRHPVQSFVYPEDSKQLSLVASMAEYVGSIAPGA